MGCQICRTKNYSKLNHDEHQLPVLFPRLFLYNLGEHLCCCFLKKCEPSLCNCYLQLFYLPPLIMICSLLGRNISLLYSRVSKDSTFPMISMAMAISGMFIMFISRCNCMQQKCKNVIKKKKFF